VSSGIEEGEMNVGEIKEAVEGFSGQFLTAKMNEGKSETDMVNSSTASSGVTIPLLSTAGVAPLVRISSPSPAGNPFSSFL